MKMKKICKKAGKILVSPFIWYIRTTAKSYEIMFRDNANTMRFWM